MNKYNLYKNRNGSSGSSAWEDELHMFGLSDIDLRRIRSMRVGAVFTDESDVVWYRVS